MDIEGKTALVLGAARGIGKAVAKDLADQGARIVVTHFDWPEAAEAMQREFAEARHDFLAVKTDLRDPDQIGLLFETLRHRYGGLDILVNNIERGGMPVVHGPYVPKQWDLEIGNHVESQMVGGRPRPTPAEAGGGRHRHYPVFHRRRHRPLRTGRVDIQ